MIFGICDCVSSIVSPRNEKIPGGKISQSGYDFGTTILDLRPYTAESKAFKLSFLYWKDHLSIVLCSAQQ